MTLRHVLCFSPNNEWSAVFGIYSDLYTPGWHTHTRHEYTSIPLDQQTLHISLGNLYRCFGAHCHFSSSRKPGLGAQVLLITPQLSPLIPLYGNFFLFM